MGKLKNFINAFAGISGRHNKALREVNDWLEIVQDFLNSYGLYDSTDSSQLLEKAGDAKFDLTAINYKGRPMIKEAGNIRQQDALKLVTEIVNSAEDVRRFLIKPSLQNERLSDAIASLRLSYGKLQETLAETEYM